MPRYRNPSNTIAGRSISNFNVREITRGTFDIKKSRRRPTEQTDFSTVDEAELQNVHNAQLVLAGIAFEVCSIRGNSDCARYPEVLSADKLWAIAKVSDVLGAAGINQILVRDRKGPVELWKQGARASSEKR